MLESFLLHVDEDCGMKTVGSDGGKQVPGGSVSILELLPLSEPALPDFFETALYSVSVQLCTVLHLASACPAWNQPSRANFNPDFCTLLPLV